MSAAGSITRKTNTSGGIEVFLNNLIPIVSLLVIGYPLAPATIRPMLVGWMVVVLAATRSIWRCYFQTAEASAALTMTPVYSARIRAIPLAVSAQG